MLYFSHMYILETNDLTCFNNNGKKELLDCEIKMLYLFSKKEKENNNNNNKKSYNFSHLGTQCRL